MSRILAVAVLGFFCSACSVTRKIPEGQYLLQKVTIESDKSTPRKERITAADLEKYVRQTPNKRFLGTNFYVWLYEQANPGKQNWWNNWKRKIGQEPVLLDMSLTERSAQNLKVYMDTRGFFSSQATFEVDTTSRRRRAKVVYRTRQGEPYRIDSISYDFQDKFLEQIILPDTANTLIRPGRVFDIAVLDRERERVTAFLKERGYYNFTVNNIDYVADTLGGNHQVDVQVNIKQYLTGYNERGQAVMDNNMVYRIDRINVFPAYDPTVARTDSTFLSRLDTLYYRGLNIIYEKRPNLRPAILRQSVPLYPNYVYNSAQVNRAYTDLMSLGYFKSAKIAFVEQPRSVDVTNYVSFIGASADSTQTRFTNEGYRRLPEPQHLPGSGGAGRFVYGGIRVYEGARRQEKARHGIRRYHRTHLPAFSGAVAYAAVSFGEPAEDQGGAFGQFSGPPLLSAYAFECGNHLPVDQQPLLFVLAAARRYQCRRCESAGLDLPRQDDE